MGLFCYLYIKFSVLIKAFFIFTYFYSHNSAFYNIFLQICNYVTTMCSTEQFYRTFVPYSVRVWNYLPNEIVNASNIDIFRLIEIFIQN